MRQRRKGRDWQLGEMEEKKRGNSSFCFSDSLDSLMTHLNCSHSFFLNVILLLFKNCLSGKKPLQQLRTQSENSDVSSGPDTSHH